jgi:hypothetical protein
MRVFLFFLAPILLNAFSLSTVLKETSVKTPVIAGSTKPFENFDPLGFSKEEEKINFYREAELKHGRLAMMAAPLIPIVEQQTHRPGIHEFEKLPPSLQIGFVSIMFVSEFSSMIRGWKNPFGLTSKDNYFKLNSDYQPGDFGFKTISDLDSDKNIELLNKELNNGRLAMIGAAGMIAQELVTGNPLF